MIIIGNKAAKNRGVEVDIIMNVEVRSKIIHNKSLKWIGMINSKELTSLLNLLKLKIIYFFK